MRQLFQIGFVFVLAFNLLFVGNVVPAHGQVQDQQTCVDTDGDGLDDATGEACPVEAAADPTDEPTVEPTSEPTTEPTAEPTVEPTSEPTTEPTAEPTVEPTSEPTVEPTVEPTIEPTAEPTVEPTIEPTTEPTVAVSSDTTGEIQTAAVVGTWTSQYIGIQNVGTSNSTIDLELRAHSQTDNTIAQTIGGQSIFNGGGIIILPSQIASNGSFGGVINADQSVAAAVLNDNSTYGVADLYMATAAPAQKLNLPKVFRHHFGLTSKFYIQNAHSSAQNITVNVFAIGNGTPVATKTYNNVPANAAFTIDFANDPDYNGLPAGDNVGSGAATVEGSAGPVAVVVDSIQDQASLSNDQKQYLYNGIPDADAGTTLIHAKAFSNHFGLFSGVAVSNITNQTTNVTVEFVTGIGSGTSAAKQLGPFESTSFFLPAESVPSGNGASGSLIIRSSNPAANIVAVITSARDATAGGTGSQTPAISQSSPSITNQVAVPLVFGSSINSWQTGVGVYAVEAGTVTATFVKAGQDPNVAGNKFGPYSSSPLSAGQITNFYVPGLSGFDQGLTGVVFLQSTGKIIALTTYDMGDSLGSMPGQNY